MKLKQLMNSRAVQISAAVGTVVGMVLGVATFAGATTYDPTSALTGLANSATSSAAPIIVAVAASLIPLLIVFLIVKWVFGLFGRRGHV